MITHPMGQTIHFLEAVDDWPIVIGGGWILKTDSKVFEVLVSIFASLYIHLTKYLQVPVHASLEHYLLNLNNTVNQSDLPSMQVVYRIAFGHASWNTSFATSSCMLEIASLPSRQQPLTILTQSDSINEIQSNHWKGPKIQLYKSKYFTNGLTLIGLQ